MSHVDTKRMLEHRMLIARQGDTGSAKGNGNTGSGNSDGNGSSSNTSTSAETQTTSFTSTAATSSPVTNTSSKTSSSASPTSTSSSVVSTGSKSSTQTSSSSTQSSSSSSSIIPTSTSTSSSLSSSSTSSSSSSSSSTASTSSVSILQSTETFTSTASITSAPSVNSVGSATRLTNTSVSGQTISADSTSSATASGAINTGAVVGGIAGGLIGVAIIGVLIACLLRRKRRRVRLEEWNASQFRRSAMVVDEEPRAPSMFQTRSPAGHTVSPSITSTTGPGMAGHGAFYRAGTEPVQLAQSAQPEYPAQTHPYGQAHDQYQYQDAIRQETTHTAGLQPRPQYTFGQVVNSTGVASDDGHDIIAEAHGAYSSDPQPQQAYDAAAYGNYAYSPEAGNYTSGAHVSQSPTHGHTFSTGSTGTVRREEDAYGGI